MGCLFKDKDNYRVEDITDENTWRIIFKLHNGLKQVKIELGIHNINKNLAEQMEATIEGSFAFYEKDRCMLKSTMSITAVIEGGVPLGINLNEHAGYLDFLIKSNEFLQRLQKTIFEN